MLHIILLILKIIGIVLLVLLGLLLLAAVCVLFVPVRYRVRLERREGEGQPPVLVYVKAAWLFHLVNVLVRYPAKVTVRVRLFLITLFRMPKKEKAERKRRTKKRQEMPAQDTGQRAADEDGAEGTGGTPDTVIHREDAGTPKEPYSAFADGYVSPDGSEGADNAGEEERPASLFVRIGAVWARVRALFAKIKGLFQNIRYTIRRICDKIKSVSDNIGYYREVMEGEPFRNSLTLCRSELLRIFRMLEPDRFEAELVVGMSDPAATGEILAVYGMLYPLIGQRVRVTGDFTCERTRIEGRLYVRGRIRAFTLIRAVVRIYLNKDIRKLIRLLKKEAA